MSTRFTLMIRARRTTRASIGTGTSARATSAPTHCVAWPATRNSNTLPSSSKPPTTIRAQISKISQCSVRLFHSVDVATGLHKGPEMPRACPVEYRVGRYPRRMVGLGCHGLGPWRVHASRLFSCKRETPWDKPMASRHSSFHFVLARNVRHHGTSPWHPDILLFTLC